MITVLVHAYINFINYQQFKFETKLNPNTKTSTTRQDKKAVLSQR